MEVFVFVAVTDLIVPQALSLWANSNISFRLTNDEYQAAALPKYSIITPIVLIPDLLPVL
jgi:hypothetical protein